MEALILMNNNKFIYYIRAGERFVTLWIHRLWKCKEHYAHWRHACLLLPGNVVVYILFFKEEREKLLSFITIELGSKVKMLFKIYLHKIQDIRSTILKLHRLVYLNSMKKGNLCKKLLHRNLSPISFAKYKVTRSSL